MKELWIEKHRNEEELVMSIAGEYDPNIHFITQIENEKFSYLFDKDLNELIAYLTEAGFENNNIIEMNLAMYGQVIDFYEIGEDSEKFYVMGLGCK